MKKQVHHIHDKGYRTFFENKEIFLELLQSFIKETWPELIDPTSLKEVKSHFILRDFEESELDVVYKAKIQDEEIYFIVLLELQSSVDHSMPIRLLFYMNEIWRKYVKKHKDEGIKSATFKLPSIVPIVLYNGAEKWTVPLVFKEKLKKLELFGNNVLNFNYYLINVNTYYKEELLELGNTISSVFLLDQYIDEDEYFDRVGEIAEIYKALSKAHQLKLKDWLDNTLNEPYKSAVIKILENGKDEVSKMTPGFVQYQERKLEEAREQGIEQGILRAARALLDILNDQEIAERLDLPISVVKTLREKEAE